MQEMHNCHAIKMLNISDKIDSYNKHIAPSALLH